MQERWTDFLREMNHTQQLRLRIQLYVTPDTPSI